MIEIPNPDQPPIADLLCKGVLASRAVTAMRLAALENRG
jgi:hypothetical protein